MNAREIEERAKDIIAGKLTGLVPMTEAEIAAWIEGWKEGADRSARLLKARIDAYRATPR